MILAELGSLDGVSIMVASRSSLIGRGKGGAGGGDDSGSGVDDRTVLMMISASAVRFSVSFHLQELSTARMTFAIYSGAFRQIERDRNTNIPV